MVESRCTRSTRSILVEEGKPGAEGKRATAVGRRRQAVSPDIAGTLRQTSAPLPELMGANLEVKCRSTLGSEMIR